MNDAPHDHDRPDTADMRAALRAARAILDGAKPADVHEAVETGACPACVAVAGISFGVNLAAAMLGDKAFVSERSRRAMLAAVERAERDLREESN